MGDPWVGLDQRDKERSKAGVLARELDGKGGKDEVEVSPILEISRAEERGTKLSIRERPFRNRLGDSSLACPSQPVQPVDRGFGEVPSPEFNLVQNRLTCSLETTVAFAMPKLSSLRTTEIVQDSGFDYQKSMSKACSQKQRVP